MGKLIAVVLTQIYFNNRTEEIKSGPRLIIGYPTSLMTCVTWHYGHEQWWRAAAFNLFSRVGHNCGHKKAAVGAEKVCDWGVVLFSVKKGMFSREQSVLCKFGFELQVAHEISANI